MQCFVFQDWLTLRGSTSAAASVTQTESAWLDLSAYQDVVAWLDVREVTPPTSGGTLYLDLQSGPAKDEAYFTSLVNQPGTSTTGIALAANTGSPTTQRLLHDAGAYTPLSRWMRWVVSTNGVNPTQQWDVTFRILLAVSYALR